MSNLPYLNCVTGFRFPGLSYFRQSSLRALSEDGGQRRKAWESFSESFWRDEACVFILIWSPQDGSRGDLGQGYTLKARFRNWLTKCLRVPSSVCVGEFIRTISLPLSSQASYRHKSKTKEFEISVKERIESSEVLFGAKGSSEARECLVAGGLGRLANQCFSG